MVLGRRGAGGRLAGTTGARSTSMGRGLGAAVRVEAARVAFRFSSTLRSLTRCFCCATLFRLFKLCPPFVIPRRAPRRPAKGMAGTAHRRGQNPYPGYDCTLPAPEGARTHHSQVGPNLECGGRSRRFGIGEDTPRGTTNPRPRHSCPRSSAHHRAGRDPKRRLRAPHSKSGPPENPTRTDIVILGASCHPERILSS